MSREEILQFLSADWQGTVLEIKSALGTEINLLGRVNEGILNHAGKMLRPMVALLCARICAGKCTAETLKFAAAVEILHNATLLHDDVADESTLRRGEPTLMSLIGPSSAVLVGDFWLASAMRVVMDAQHREQAASYFSNTLIDLAEGEMFQLQKAQGADTSFEDYYRIIYNKTASLFVTAACCGALSVDASKEQFEAVKEYATALGMAFQIKDDILDYDGTDTLGKPVGLDLKERKITLPLLCALEKDLAEEQIRQKVAMIREHPEYSAQIRKFVADKGGVGRAAGILDSYIKKAEKALEVFEDGEAKRHMVQIVRYNSFRRQ